MSWLGKKFNTPVGMSKCIQLSAVKKLSFRASPRFKDVYTDDIGFCSSTNGSFLRCRYVLLRCEMIEEELGECASGQM
jgi:hypothetical protein